jgi:hypothetical protein
MSNFYESQNFLIAVGAIGMITTSILACLYKLKIKDCNMCFGLCRISRDVSAENLELQIESRTRRDTIPAPIIPINPLSLLPLPIPITRRSASMV